jgi:hypothetical protein
VDERASWTANRETKYEEDMAYSLFEIFDIFLPLLYSEGREHAFRRLREEVNRSLKSRPLENSPNWGKVSSSDVEYGHKTPQDQLLRSLRDENMNARKNQIDEPHTKTFTLIFDEETHRPWDSFLDWLGCNEKIY